MLLLPFVENSFKHSVSKQRKAVWIHIVLRSDKNNLIFEIHNTIPERHRAGPAGGIGIANVRKRLELLFDHSFELKIESGKNFSIFLSFPVETGKRP